MNARFQPTLFLPLTGSLRARIEATIETLTALLDEIDGDENLEPDSEGEPWLGATVSGSWDGHGYDLEDGEDPAEDGDADEEDFRDYDELEPLDF